MFSRIFPDYESTNFFTHISQLKKKTNFLLVQNIFLKKSKEILSNIVSFQLRNIGKKIVKKCRELDIR